MIQETVYTLLTGDMAVAALVGDRVYPLVIPEQVYDAATKRPCIVYQRDGLDKSRTFCGTIGLQYSSFAFDCYARKYLDAQAVAEAVKSLFEDYQGGVIDDVLFENQFDGLDPEPGLFRVRVTLGFWHA